MEDIHSRLCNNPIRGVACGECIWGVLDPYLIDNLDLYCLIDMVISLLKQLRYMDDRMCLETSRVNCKGYTMLRTVPVSKPKYAYRNNVIVCEELFSAWEYAVDTTDWDEEVLEELDRAMDDTHNLNSLIIAFQVIQAAIEC